MQNSFNRRVEGNAKKFAYFHRDIANLADDVIPKIMSIRPESNEQPTKTDPGKFQEEILEEIPQESLCEPRSNFGDTITSPSDNEISKTMKPLQEIERTWKSINNLENQSKKIIAVESQFRGSNPVQYFHAAGLATTGLEKRIRNTKSLAYRYRYDALNIAGIHK